MRIIGYQTFYQSLMALIQPMQLKSTSDSTGPHSPHQANLLHAIPNGPKRVSESNGDSYFVFCTTHYTQNIFSTTHKHLIPWIIDSGATDHITSSLDYFTSYSKIKPIKINLPNGDSVTAYFSGTVKFSQNFIIPLNC